ncbi:hypothetical protein GCM10023094_28960 [Rhodococcus olei]|uniref:Uncharacterized protein n=1 Tax=Rhodococcus olei TaxID=2161675 RepID=A0ABP8P6N1_9NOCA
MRATSLGGTARDPCVERFTWTVSVLEPGSGDERAVPIDPRDDLVVVTWNAAIAATDDLTWQRNVRAVSCGRRAECAPLRPISAQRAPHFSQATPSPSRSSFVLYPGDPAYRGAAPAALTAAQFA